MVRVYFYCIFQRKRYRFNSPQNIRVSELEKLLRKRLNVPSNYKFRKVNGISFNSNLEENDLFEFIETIEKAKCESKDMTYAPDDLQNSIGIMEPIYGPPSVFGIEETSEDHNSSWM